MRFIDQSDRSQFQRQHLRAPHDINFKLVASFSSFIKSANDTLPKFTLPQNCF